MARKKQEIPTKVNGLINFETYDGLLFVGDPHITAYKPGTRTDENFLNVSLDKIEQAVEIAKSNNLYMIILGDLFDDDQETNPLMLTKLIKILKKLPNPAVTIVGNHEKVQTNLTDDTFLAALRESGCIYTIEGNGFWGRFKFNQDVVYLGGTAYGKQIPNDLKQLYDYNQMEFGAQTIWLTHHDLAIGTFYPGCITPFEVVGCDMIVNGHDHTPKDPVKVGQTTYFNPGNILRMSVDKKDQIPKVWKWSPDKKIHLEPIELRYKKDVFNLIGRQVVVKKEEKSVENTIKQNDSKFLDLLKIQQESQNSNLSDIEKTNDASVLEQSILSLGAALNIEKQMLQELQDMAKDCAKD